MVTTPQRGIYTELLHNMPAYPGVAAGDIPWWMHVSATCYLVSFPLALALLVQLLVAMLRSKQVHNGAQPAQLA